MAIRTFEDTQGFDTGSTGPRATPDSFGASTAEGLERLGEGLTRGARSGSRGIKLLETQARQAQAIEDNSWASDQYERSKRASVEFMADPANNTQGDFSQKFDQFTQSHLASVSPDSAPSQKAYQQYKDNFTSWSAARYGQALQTSYQNKAQAAVASVSTQMDDAFQSYRAAKAAGPDAAVSEVTDSVAHISAGIEANFRKYAPETADRLSSSLYTQAALAVMGDSPEAARSILDSAPFIDEQTRMRLGKEIDAASKSRDQGEVDAFQGIRKDVLVRGEAGQDSRISRDKYDAFLPKDQAQRAFDQDNYQMDVYAAGNRALEAAQPLEAGYQQKQLAQLRAAAGNSQKDQDIYDWAAPKILRNIKMQQENPAGWLMQSNPQVRQLARDAQEAAAGDQPGALKSLNDAVVKYQGPPPEISQAELRSMQLSLPSVKLSDGSVATVKSISVSDDNGSYVIPTIVGGKEVSKDEAIKAWQNGKSAAIGGPFKTDAEADKYSTDFHDAEAKRLSGKLDDVRLYLNKPKNDWSVMDQSTAVQAAGQLNSASPKEFIKSMGDVLARFPGEQAGYLAFNDLVTMGGLSQQYQFAWLNKDQPWLDGYLGAVHAGKAVRMPEAAYHEAEKQLEVSPVWTKFAGAMMGDNFQRAGQLDGFKNGIMQYAQALSSQGYSPKQSIQKATDKLISSTLGIASVNGKPLVIPRSQGEALPPMTDLQVAETGKELEYAVRMIDPRDVDAAPFLPLKILGRDADRAPGIEALKNAISVAGTWQTSQDGKTVSLYYPDSDGRYFQLRDKSTGRPFEANIQEMRNHPVWQSDAQYDEASETWVGSGRPHYSDYPKYGPRSYFNAETFRGTPSFIRH